MGLKGERQPFVQWLEKKARCGKWLRSSGWKQFLPEAKAIPVGMLMPGCPTCHGYPPSGPSAVLSVQPSQLHPGLG